jgi:hypothetical protein
MAQRTWTIPIKADFCGNYRNRFRLALGAGHVYTSKSDTGTTKNNPILKVFQP